MLCTAECECSVGPSSSCTSCVAQQAAHNTLHKVFGFSEFRSGQLEAILPALHICPNGNRIREITVHVYGPTCAVQYCYGDCDKPSEFPNG